MFRDEFGYRDSGRHVALTRDNSRDFGGLSRDTSRQGSNHRSEGIFLNTKRL